MSSNAERRARIAELQAQLKRDVATLERNFRAAAATLERECKQAVAAIEAEASQQAAAELEAARARVQQVLQETGIDSTTLLAGWKDAYKVAGERRPYRAPSVVHQGPNGQVWTGRGRMPGWFKAQRQGGADAR